MSKKKPQKMALSEFLADQGTGSWADEDILPTAPAAEPESYATHSSSRQSNVASKPIPSQPPYTAFLGNLPNTTREEDLKEFFEGLAVTSIRLRNGFGYVEFANARDLELCLQVNDEVFMGRRMRVDIAEPPKNPQREPREERREPVGPWRLSDEDYQKRNQEVASRRQESGMGDRSRNAAPMKRELSNQSFERIERPVQVPRTGPKPNPFGAAVPKDTTEAVKKAEAKIKAKQEALRKPHTESDVKAKVEENKKQPAKKEEKPLAWRRQ